MPQLNGAVITMDALHLDKETIDLIKISKQGEALIGLKNNNKSVLDQAKSKFDTEKMKFTYLDKESSKHGRIESRTIEIINFKCQKEHCREINCAMRIISSRKPKNGNQSEEIRYFVATFSFDKYTPEKCLNLIRGHWAIENQLHYVKDRSMHEDRCTAQGNTGANLSLLRSAIILLKKKSFNKRYFPNGALKGNADKAIELITNFIK